MALEQSRFFNSVSSDRTYQADDFAEFFRIFLTSGIKNGGTNLQVTAPGSGMTVNVDYGEAMIQGYAYWLKNNNGVPKSLTIGTAPSTNPRIDRIVLQLDKGSSNRLISVKVKAGTPSSNPSPPSLTRTSNIYELSLAKIYVGKDVTVISSSNITDERYDGTVCGLMNSLIALDGSQFVAQAQAIIAQMQQGSFLPIDGKAADSDKLDGKDSTEFATANHTHTGYASSTHNHDTVYAAKSHIHEGYASSTHNHDTVYAAKSHTHNYEPVLNADQKRKITISTSNPSGGVNGDIWIKII